MKYLVILFILSFIYACGDDIINNNGGNPTADFDIYLVKSKDTSYNMATYTVDSDGSNLKIFNDSLTIASQSRNGKILLAKVSNVNMVTSIYYAEENGTNIVKIPFQQIPTYIDLSQDAAKILFTVNTNASLDIANLDGTSPLRLSNNIFGTFYMPKFSPVGNKIAYLEEISNPLNGLYIIDPDGMNKKLLKDSIRVLDFYSLDWSPDGSKIVYQSRKGNLNEPVIYIIDTTGNNLEILTGGFNPLWSPNGTKISFLGFGMSNQNDLYLMNPDGTGIVNITNSSGIYEGNGRWSADGTKLLFSQQYLNSISLSYYIYNLNLNTSSFLIDSVKGAIWK